MSEVLRATVPVPYDRFTVKQMTVITTRLERDEAAAFAKACEADGRSMAATLRRLAVEHALNEEEPRAGGAGLPEHRGDGAHAGTP